MLPLGVPFANDLPGFFAPEIFEGSPHGKKADIYSLGKTYIDLTLSTFDLLKKDLDATDEFRTLVLEQLCTKMCQIDPFARPYIDTVIRELKKIQ